MKTTDKPLFSNGTEFTSWTFRNCDKCVKQSHYNEKNDTYSAFRCSIDRDISMQQVGLNEVNLKSWETTQLKDCPHIQTERKVTKKRVIKNQTILEI
jgi:hypothetical protein